MYQIKLIFSLWLLLMRIACEGGVETANSLEWFDFLTGLISNGNSVETPKNDKEIVTQNFTGNNSKSFNITTKAVYLSDCQHVTLLIQRNFVCECEALFFPATISFSNVCDGWTDCTDGSDEIDCICSEDDFQCGCDDSDGCLAKDRVIYQCIPKAYVNDSIVDCASWKDEPKLLEAKLLFESTKLNTTVQPTSVSTLLGPCVGIPCNGYIECPQLTSHDERDCTSCPSNRPNRCDCNKENNTVCNEKGYVCYADAEKCDNVHTCVDSTDEHDCLYCGDDQFTCRCYKDRINKVSSIFANSNCSFDKACISSNRRFDGSNDCLDGSDELRPNEIFLQQCSWSDQTLFSIFRFNNKSDCENHEPYHITAAQNTIEFSIESSLKNKSYENKCNVSSCYETLSYQCFIKNCSATEFICSSYQYSDTCSSDQRNPIFQCTNGNLILALEFCDGIDDCDDNSDEIRYQPGFKCTQTRGECVLPQLNLHDNVSHCDNAYDLCDSSDACFECFDKRLLISSRQVCNGVIDCYDFSDECLCDINIYEPNCDAIFMKHDEDSTTICPYNGLLKEINSKLFYQNPWLLYSLLPDSIGTNLKDILSDTNTNTSRFTCETKQGTTSAILCDGRPECKDFSDECNCDNPPSFCTDPCLSYYPLGDRYCDGVIDEAWKFINDTACPRGFDEKLCPGRFDCKSGDKVSIYDTQLCDGRIDCDDGSDELECSALFSSDTEMIANPALRSAFWIMGFAVIMGNSLVIATTTNHLRTADLTDSLRCQHLIILNISCADFIMGIYLITVAIFSQIFSGIYGLVDADWRASLRCSIIGSLAVVSSEASCFLMIILSAYRLYTISNPYATMTMSTFRWKVALSAAWVTSLAFAMLPIPHHTLEYFVHSVFFPSQFSFKETWNKASLSKFACHFAAMQNLTINYQGSEWNSKRNFLEKHFPENAPLKEFGYYGETSVCMPRFYVSSGDNAWQYTSAIITINFLAFILIVVSYIAMFISFRKQRQEFKNKTSSKQEATMQKRIARIIATDFVCWIPICIMSYTRLSGIEFSSIVYQIGAVFLLPINSALNPFLYSSLVDKLMKKMICCSKKN